MQHAVLLVGSVPAMGMPILDDIVARLPDWTEGSNKRATVLYLIGEYDRSLANCDRVLGLESSHFGVLAGIGLIRNRKDESARVGGLGSGRSLHLGAASKCEHWRSIDLADLKRMGLLKTLVGGRVKAITWKRDDGGLDKLGIIPSARGVQFVKRDDQGKLAGLFVAYTYTPTMFGGARKWFACPGCRRPARILYGAGQQPAMSAVPRIEVRLPI